jgi:hypothetical protein
MKKVELKVFMKTRESVVYNIWLLYELQFYIEKLIAKYLAINLICSIFKGFNIYLLVFKVVKLFQMYFDLIVISAILLRSKIKS